MNRDIEDDDCILMMLVIIYRGVRLSGLPWLMDLISMVWGILSSSLGITDLRLTLDLNKVLMRVDLPRPL